MDGLNKQKRRKVEEESTKEKSGEEKSGLDDLQEYDAKLKKAVEYKIPADSFRDSNLHGEKIGTQLGVYNKDDLKAMLLDVLGKGGPDSYYNNQTQDMLRLHLHARMELLRLKKKQKEEDNILAQVLGDRGVRGQSSSSRKG